MDKQSLNLNRFALGWLTVLTIWSVCSYLINVSPFYLAPPMQVLNYLLDNFKSLSYHLCFTAIQAILGWLSSILIGLIFGILLYYSKELKNFLWPLVLMSQTTPIIAMVPLITLWFGYDIFAKIIVVLFISLFPILMATYNGLSNVKPNYIILYKLAGASEFTILLKVRLRSAWTIISPSIKVSLIFAVVGSLIAEFMGGNTGLGFLIMKAIYSSKSVLLLSSVLLSSILGQVLLLILEILLSRLDFKITH